MILGGAVMMGKKQFNHPFDLGSCYYITNFSKEEDAKSMDHSCMVFWPLLTLCT